jgi:predicted nuclease of predicted toxin-antitoxin system
MGARASRARVRLCLDEHYSAQIAIELRDRGHDAISAKEDPALVGLSDDELLAFARRERRTLVTENVADYMPLATAGEPHPGFVFTSPRSMPRSRETIGLYVKALEALLARFPGDAEFSDRIEWLRPPDTP